MKILILFPLFLYIVNATPLYQAEYPRLLTYNYNRFDNVMQHDDNNADVHYRNLLNAKRIGNGNLINSNIDDYEEEFLEPIPTQDVGLDDDEDYEDTSETYPATISTFYDYYTPLTSINPIYQVPSFQQPFIRHELQQLSLRIDQSPLINALFSLENVPLLHPLILINQPSPYDDQTANKPPQSMRRFSFAMPEMKFPDISSKFSNFDNFFDSKFNSKTFLPARVQNSMHNDAGNPPAVIQIGKNNKNIKSGSQHGIVQINNKFKGYFYNNLRRTTEAQPETTTDYPSTETSTQEMDTTTFMTADMSEY